MVRPVVLRNPRWAQPFELFSRLLGMPSASEADPSRLLAFVAPLMFGYMFADVGQGAVLIVAGAALRRRFPATELLIPGGTAAIVFGFLFGSVFANEQILPALWLRPLDRPLVMLEVSLAFGACVILLGLALDAVQHHWSGRGAEWWANARGTRAVLCGHDLRALRQPRLVGTARRLRLVSHRQRRARALESAEPPRHCRGRIAGDSAAARDQYDLIRAHRRLCARARGARFRRDRSRGESRRGRRRTAGARG